MDLIAAATSSYRFLMEEDLPVVMVYMLMIPVSGSVADFRVAAAISSIDCVTSSSLTYRESLILAKA